MDDVEDIVGELGPDALVEITEGFDKSIGTS